MRQMFLRYVPIRGPVSEYRIDEEPIPINRGETVVTAWPISEKLVAVLTVYTPLSDLRHRREMEDGR